MFAPPDFARCMMSYGFVLYSASSLTDTKRRAFHTASNFVGVLGKKIFLRSLKIHYISVEDFPLSFI